MNSQEIHKLLLISIFNIFRNCKIVSHYYFLGYLLDGCGVNLVGGGLGYAFQLFTLALLWDQASI